VDEVSRQGGSASDFGLPVARYRLRTGFGRRVAGSVLIVVVVGGLGLGSLATGRRTIGFVSRQLAAAVNWQASVAAVIGIVVGIPLGIVAGRWLWDLFAGQIYAVPYPTVPPGSVVLIALGPLVLANVVAAVPARWAARTRTAMLLRAE
jgi:hypothetical protein